MTTPLPTPAEVEGMRERHVPYAPFAPSDEVEFCRCCERRWPCDAARLLAVVCTTCWLTTCDCEED